MSEISVPMKGAPLSLVPWGDAGRWRSAVWKRGLTGANRVGALSIDF